MVKVLYIYKTPLYGRAQSAPWMPSTPINCSCANRVCRRENGKSYKHLNVQNPRANDFWRVAKTKRETGCEMLSHCFEKVHQCQVWLSTIIILITCITYIHSSAIAYPFWWKSTIVAPLANSNSAKISKFESDTARTHTAKRPDNDDEHDFNLKVKVCAAAGSQVYNIISTESEIRFGSMRGG